jgi:hypothetical protein
MASAVGQRRRHPKTHMWPVDNLAMRALRCVLVQRKQQFAEADRGSIGA